MMALVWLIDLLVILIKILGGRMQVNPILRYGLWVAVLSALVAGFALIGFALYFLQKALAGTL